MIPLAKFQGLRAKAPPLDPTVLLCHFDGGNGSTAFTDSSSYANTLTGYNSAAQSTTQTKFGASSFLSAESNPTSPYVSMPNTHMNFGVGSFTVELWYYYSSTDPPSSQGMFLDNGGLGFTPAFGVSTANLTYFIAGGVDGPILAHGMSQNAWHHLAWVRNGSNISIFVDGVSIGGGTDTQNANPASGAVAVINSYTAALGSYSCGGFIDEIRVSKGVARYTGNFTPPAAPF